MTTDTLLVNASLVLDLEGNQLRWTGWALSADMQYVLFKTDHLKQWRHSSFGNYWIHRRQDSVTFPVIPPTSPPTIAKCTWSPVGHALAFVSKNDVYIISEDNLSSVSSSSSSSPPHVRVTTDGSHTIFNGVPDWVYEEEVLESNTALWWSPDGKRVAFLRSDESKVHDFKLQYYNPSDDAFKVHQYQTELDMKCVSFFLLLLSFSLVVVLWLTFITDTPSLVHPTPPSQSTHFPSLPSHPPPPPRPPHSVSPGQANSPSQTASSPK